MKKVSNISLKKLSMKGLIVFGIFISLASGNKLLGIHPMVNIPMDEKQSVERVVDRDTITPGVENESKEIKIYTPAEIRKWNRDLKKGWDATNPKEAKERKRKNLLTLILIIDVLIILGAGIAFYFIVKDLD